MSANSICFCGEWKKKHNIYLEIYPYLTGAMEYTQSASSGQDLCYSQKLFYQIKIDTPVELLLQFFFVCVSVVSYVALVLSLFVPLCFLTLVLLNKLRCHTYF